MTDVITVTEEEIISAWRLVWERMKLMIESSAAVGVAAVFIGKISSSSCARSEECWGYSVRWKCRFGQSALEKITAFNYPQEKVV